jgi:hypothetical protein
MHRLQEGVRFVRRDQGERLETASDNEYRLPVVNNNFEKFCQKRTCFGVTLRHHAWHATYAIPDEFPVQTILAGVKTMSDPPRRPALASSQRHPRHPVRL